MMSSKRAQSFMEPISQGKRARLEDTMGTAAPPGPSKEDSLPPLSQEKSLAYRQHYLSCPHSRQDTSQWSPNRITVRNGVSPVIHPSTTGGSITNPVYYRAENVTFPEDSRSPTAAEDLASKHKFAYYTRSPSEHRPSGAGLASHDAFKKIPIGCTSVSPLATENSGGIAVPKPVYGHSPCCSERKCTLGNNFAMEQGLHRVPPPMFEDDRMAYYGHWAYLHRKDQEALMQQRQLSFDHYREGAPLKDVAIEGNYGFRPTRPTPISPFSDPSQRNYMCSPVSSFVTSQSERCQHVQMTTQAHKDLPRMYEPLTEVQYGPHLRVYQDCHRISKYGEITQHSSPCCPKNNTDAYRQQKPHLIIDKQIGPCKVPPPYFGDLPNPYARFHPGHPSVSNVSAFPTYRMPINTSNVNTFTKRPFCPRVVQQGDRPLDFSMRRDLTADCYEKPERQPGIWETCHETAPQAHLRTYRVLNYVHAENANHNGLCQGQDCCSIGRHDSTNSPKCTGKLVNEKQILCDYDQSDNGAISSKSHREENDSGSETDSLRIVHKKDKQKSDDIDGPSSPPMPVINNVFSLAPYKAYLEATGMLSPAGNPQCPKLEPNSQATKKEQETQDMDRKANLDQDELHLEEAKKPPACSHDLTDVKFRKEKSYEPEMHKIPTPVFSHNNDDVNIKEEQADVEDEADAPQNHVVVVKSDFEPDYKPVTPEMPEKSTQSDIKCSVMDDVETVLSNKHSDPPFALASTPPVTPQATFPICKIPPHCLKLTSYKIILPEVLKTSPVSEVPQSPVDIKPNIRSRQARHKFLELHQSLCGLVTGSISHTSRCELRNWLSSLDLAKLGTAPAKIQKVSCLLGPKAREVWMKGEETVTALQNVLCQLERYVKCRECPFPHVIRAGAVFIPMLVVKEILFPQVQGTFVDQVLQEHRVELRPTTLSEERQLTQLHKRAFTSKLRRLLSLKHLTDIYPDVLTLLYYASVCKFLDSTSTDDVQKLLRCLWLPMWSVPHTMKSLASLKKNFQEVMSHLAELEVNSACKKECVEFSDNAESPIDVFEMDCMVPMPFTPDGATYLERNLKQNSCHKSYKSKGRVKSACKRTFLGDDTSTEDEHTQESEIWSFADSLGGEGWEDIPVSCSNDEGHIEVRIEEDAEQEPENFWGQPLTSDDLSSESTDTDTERESWPSRPSCSSGSNGSSSFSKRRSDMVLKLRKVYYTHKRQGQVSHYQRVPDSQSEIERGRGTNRRCHRKMKHRSSQSTNRRSSRSQHRSPPYTHCVSKCRRSWVLRSAVRNAHQSISNSYPDLVGKRIRHLYEENDKTEVWYKGVVVRIHEPHSNPLKTVFEVKYDSEPEWQYYLELLVDYKKGWLQIED